MAAVCASGVYGSCKATVSSFSTQDATILTQLAHVGEFTLQCSGAAPASLFAEFPCGKVVPVAKVGDNKYQVSEKCPLLSVGQILMAVLFTGELGGGHQAGQQRKRPGASLR